MGTPATGKVLASDVRSTNARSSALRCRALVRIYDLPKVREAHSLAHGGGTNGGARLGPEILDVVESGRPRLKSDFSFRDARDLNW